MIDFETVFSETKAVFEVLLNSDFLASCDSFREKRIALSDVTSDFFYVCEMLFENQKTAGSQRYSFQHRVMSHAIVVVMHLSESLSLEELDKQKVLARFEKDWESSKT